MDYFATVERDLAAAVRRRAHRGWRVRLRSLDRRVALIAAGCAVTAGSALAATGVIPLGSPVRVPAGLNPHVGSGIPAPGGSRVLPLTYADPGGGPPWGARVVHTTRGLVCLQVARVQDGRLGELGIDGAFHDDGRFHPLSAEALPDAGKLGGPRSPQGAENAICELPAEVFSGQRIGIEQSAGGPADTSHRPRAQLRDLYFGMLGPQAVSVTLGEGASRVTQSVVPELGAYLFVTRTNGRDVVGTGAGAIGSAGGVGPVKPLTAIAYRLGGSLCERLLPNTRPAHPCPPPQSLYPPRAKSATPLDVRLKARLEVSRGIARGVVVRFRAPFAVRGAAAKYALQLPIGGCRGSGGGYSAQFTDRDIAAGEEIELRLGDPFGNACGRRTQLLQVFYDGAGLAQRRIGSAALHLPRGVRPERVHRRRHR